MTDLGIDLARIRALADAFDASDWDEVDMVVGEVRIQFSALPPGADPGTRTAPTAVPVPTPSAAPTPAGEPSDGTVRSAPEPVPADVPPGATGTGVPAPSPGIFWRAPSPGAPPFVTVGDRVDADTVIGIVELMKLMNRVAAGVAGTVTAVLVENGASVEKGGSLVLIEPGS